jgi:hypothetical protein
MFDVEQRHSISVEELRDRLVGGENFEAETEESGRDCTVEVLRRVMGGGGLDPLSGQGGLPISAAGGLGGLGALGGLLGLAQVFGDRVDGYDRDRREPPRDERPRRVRPRTRPADWAEDREPLSGRRTDGGSA